MENVRAQMQMCPAAPPAPLLGQPLPWFSLWNGLSHFGGAALERPLTSGTALRKILEDFGSGFVKALFGPSAEKLENFLGTPFGKVEQL